MIQNAKFGRARVFVLVRLFYLNFRIFYGVGKFMLLQVLKEMSKNKKIY